MNKTRLWLLGAPDPEMVRIEKLLLDAGEVVEYACTADGAQVAPHTAYKAAVPALDGVDELHLVECGFNETVPDGVAVVVFDHHRPGDRGYGQPAEQYWLASSLGQVVNWLWEHDLPARITTDLLMAAAADHCLAAAYRGLCPRVNPEALMRWRAETRAAFQGRTVASVLADVEAARAALRAAPVLQLDPDRTLPAADMRGRQVPELPEAAVREGVCFVAEQAMPDGRVKIVCQGGTPEQIRAFMEAWAPANRLAGVYGDPARGFAGGIIEKED